MVAKCQGQENMTGVRTTDARRQAVMRTIWENISQIAGDYSEVPFDQILSRPRYEFLRQILRHAAERVMELDR